MHFHWSPKGALKKGESVCERLPFSSSCEEHEAAQTEKKVKTLGFRFRFRFRSLRSGSRNRNRSRKAQWAANSKRNVHRSTRLVTKGRVRQFGSKTAVLSNPEGTLTENPHRKASSKKRVRNYSTFRPKCIFALVCECENAKWCKILVALCGACSRARAAKRSEPVASSVNEQNRTEQNRLAARRRRKRRRSRSTKLNTAMCVYIYTKVHYTWPDSAPTD